MSLSRGFSILIAGVIAIAASTSLQAAPADNVAAVPAGGSLITCSQPCVAVPVIFTRVDPTPVRGYSVTFHLSANLSQCAAPVVGDYLSSVNSSTSFEVTDNGDGTFTVDEVILGTPCGATGSDTLFTISVAGTTLSGTGQIIVDLVSIRDCDNVAVAGAPGDTGSITIDRVPPAAISNLAAAQKRTGNDTDGTTKIQLGFSLPTRVDSVEVYRSSYGDYPQYAAGSVPSAPSYPPGFPWVLTAVTDSGQTDEPASRDFYYYVVFTLDSCGGASAASNVTGGTLNYHVGDVTDGTTPGQGDNAVTMADISVLGGHYGLHGAAAVDTVGYLDFGPTVGGSVNGRPNPDNKLNFEDLILAAVNYGQVSKPAISLAAAAAVDRLTLESSIDGSDLSAALRYSGTGRVHGITARLAWNAAAVEPAGVSQGALLDLNQGLLMSEAAGAVDAAVLGRGAGLVGDGVLATVSFRRIAPGDAGIRIATAEGRDLENRAVDITGRGIGAPMGLALRAAVPNPFRAGTRVSYSLAARGPVQLSVHAVDGRRVRTLASGTLEAGGHDAEWDGRDAAGRRMAPGVYYVRLKAGGEILGRTVTLLR